MVPAGMVVVRHERERPPREDVLAAPSPPNQPRAVIGLRPRTHLTAS